MKKRAMDLVSTGIDYDLLGSILCYIMTGRMDVPAVNERAKFVYITAGSFHLVFADCDMQG